MGCQPALKEEKKALSDLKCDLIVSLVSGVKSFCCLTCTVLLLVTFSVM